MAEQKRGLKITVEDLETGDVETVERQRAAVATHASELLPLWDALRDATMALAQRRAEGHHG